MALPKYCEEKALVGLAGEFVKLILPFSESSAQALLFQFLAAFGAYVGRGPYDLIESDKHYPRIFVVIVGNTSKGRKGTSWGHIERLFEKVDRDWCKTSIMSGLSSGEGIIAQFANQDLSTRKWISIPNRQLLIVEGEFSIPLNNLSRHGNNLSGVIRNAWDDKKLTTLTKEPMSAETSHISIVAHITEDELVKLMGSTEISNGFANRFLFVKTERSKKLPYGGTPPDKEINLLAERVREVANKVRNFEKIEFTQDAKEFWEILYDILSTEEKGIASKVLSRCEAQTRRLALIYALIDGSQFIEKRHLESAYTLITYCNSSAKAIFSNSSMLCDRILGFLELSGGPVDKTEIYRELKNNVKRDALDEALGELLKSGKVKRQDLTSELGRPISYFELIHNSENLLGLTLESKFVNS